jgi:hypothetical protein
LPSGGQESLLHDSIEYRGPIEQPLLDLIYRSTDHGEQQGVGRTHRADEGKNTEHLGRAGVTYRGTGSRHRREDIGEVLVSLDHQRRTVGECAADAVRTGVRHVPEVSRRKRQLIKLSFLQWTRGPSGHNATAFAAEYNTDLGEGKISAQLVHDRLGRARQRRVLLEALVIGELEAARHEAESNRLSPRVDDLLTHKWARGFTDQDPRQFPPHVVDAAILNLVIPDGSGELLNDHEARIRKTLDVRIP